MVTNITAVGSPPKFNSCSAGQKIPYFCRTHVRKSLSLNRFQSLLNPFHPLILYFDLFLCFPPIYPLVFLSHIFHRGFLIKILYAFLVFTKFIHKSYYCIARARVCVFLHVAPNLGELWPPPYVRFRGRIFDIWQDSLDEGSARRKVSTCTGQHNTERRGQTSMPQVGFKLTIPVSKRSRPHAPDHRERHCTTALFS
jgi:hypothetical protein